MKQLAAALVLVALATPAFGRDEPARRPAVKKDGPWFGVTLPPKAGADVAVRVGARPPRPINADTATPEFNGAAIKSDVETIVRFAKTAHTSKEIGTGQMWGRISGFPSGQKPVDWAADQFRKAGI